MLPGTTAACRPLRRYSMSWTFIPSLLGINLLFWGVVMKKDGAPWSTAVVLLAFGVAFMALWVWMVRREGRR
jgi:hypothetical protein